MTAVVLRGDARSLPLPDESVDLIVTSPPYFGLRSYTDGGEHYGGQVGAEATPAQYVASLLECTAEWVRVLKPSGSLFVNLGDKYGGAQGGGGYSDKSTLAGFTRTGSGAPAPGGGYQNTKGRAMDSARPRVAPGTQPKSLLGLPWRYALTCTDQLGLILRAEIIWAKPNGLPESVTDRVRRSHEQVFHFTRQPRYYAGVDEIREPHQPQSIARTQRRYDAGDSFSVGQPNTLDPAQFCNPLGKLPGSVWTIASQPLKVPAHLGVDHFAAFPMELPRRCILGWSPPGICTACGQGRRPVSVSERTGSDALRPPVDLDRRKGGHHGMGSSTLGPRGVVAHITGYACACTPYTDHEGSGESSGEGYNRPGEGVDAGRRITFPETPGPPSRLSTRPKVGGFREYHFDRWQPPPVRPAVVLDPFGGTGTTALVASVNGRHGISVDMSADYCRLAAWRTTDPGQRAKAMQVPKPPAVPDGQDDLFSLETSSQA